MDWQRLGISYGLSTHEIEGAKKLAVDSWNNISKYEDLKDWFVIFDEQKVVGNGVWVKTFLKITKHNRWILLSGTPGDTWLDYIPVFLANKFYQNRTEFKREHVIYSSWSKYPKVERYVGVNKLVRLKNHVLVDMPFEKHTVRNDIVVGVGYDQELYETVAKKRWHVYEERPLKNMAELCLMLRRVVNTDQSRLERVRELMEQHGRLIIFYNFNSELEQLRTLADSIFVAEWNGQRHDPLPDGDRWVYLVQYAAGAEAWNCTSTDAMVFYSLTYSYKNFEQAKGRIDRLNTPYTNLWYYIFRSNAAIDVAIFKTLRTKKTFNETKYLQSLGVSKDDFE